MKIISPILKAEIARPAEGWAEHCYAILTDGSLAVVRATHDVRHELEKRWQLIDADWTGNLPPLFPVGTMAQLAVLDGKTEQSLFQFELTSAFPHLDRLTDHRWLIVDSRCMPPEENARIFDQRGALVRSICLGDGIEHLQSDREGDIWGGYFDEGVFGNQGWAPPNSVPTARIGLNRYDEFGRMTWAYVDDDQLLADCYAMNVTPDDVWTCFYTDFPILRINKAGHLRLWRNNKCGAHLMAVDSNHVVLLGGYGEEARHGSLLHLEGDFAEPIGEFRFHLDDRDPRRLSYSGARGNGLHFVHDSRWYTLSVGEIVAAFNR
jgi:hypothetical protein